MILSIALIVIVFDLLYSVSSFGVITISGFVKSVTTNSLVFVVSFPKASLTLYVIVYVQDMQEMEKLTQHL